MFLIDGPFVSDFVKESLVKYQFPVINTVVSQKMGLLKETNLISEAEALVKLKELDLPSLYTNSENAIGWISDNLTFSKIPDSIDMFKDKHRFRVLTEALYPTFFFDKVELKNIREFDIDTVSFPFIIKPNVGFFSLGVFKVNSKEEWIAAMDKIEAENDNISEFYPDKVLDTTSYIIETCIDGDEFAVDAYFDDNGEPVILNIHQHLFSSGEDVSDRVYLSSKDIVESNLEDFRKFLEDIGAVSGVKNFPVHVELRRTNDNLLIPIEVNPMRFGGWCSTADATYKAYGFNPYEYYFSKKTPNWAELFKDKEDKIYSLIVLDNSTGVEVDKIDSFNYSKILSELSNPLEVRKIDHKEFAFFGFIFAESDKNNFHEVERLLYSKLTDYI